MTKNFKIVISRFEIFTKTFHLNLVGTPCMLGYQKNCIEKVIAKFSNAHVALWLLLFRSNKHLCKHFVLTGKTLFGIFERMKKDWSTNLSLREI